MNWMIDWLRATIDWTSILVLTTVTGSVLTLIWYSVGRILEKIGFLNIQYKLLKAVLVFWFVPFSYLILRFLGQRGNWNGYLFLPTPVILKTSIIFCVVWSIGTLFFLGRYGLNLHHLYRKCRETFPCDSVTQENFDSVCRELQIPMHKIRVKQSYRLTVPVLVGVRKPNVVLPVEIYTEEELRVIFIHELTHYKQKDVLLKNMAEILACLYFFNPAVWWFGSLVERWSEYSCDYSSCEKTGGMKHYFDTILRMTMDESQSYPLSLQLVENKQVLLDRVKRMKRGVEMKKKSKIEAGAVVLCMLFLSTGSVSAATIGAADTYVDWYDSTESEVREEETAIELQEYIESEWDNSITIEVGEVNSNARSSVSTFDWNVNANSIKCSPAFSAFYGGNITVAVVLDPSDQEVKVGIMEPDGHKRYVLIKGSGTHTFELTMTGTYSVYVENKNSISIDAAGSYIVK